MHLLHPRPHSQALSKEKHAYLKVIKSINSANAKQEMAESAAAAAAAARSRLQVGLVSFAQLPRIHSNLF